MLWGTAALGAERGTFLFLFDGVPVGTVELRRDGSSYRYRSLHLFNRDGEASKRVRSAEYRITADGRDPKTGRFYESLLFWRAPPPHGCTQVKEELGSRTGELCVRSRTPMHASGTLYGHSWTGGWDDRGLRFLRIAPGSEFQRVDSPRAATLEQPPDVLARWWPVAKGEGPLDFEPRLLEAELRARFAFEPFASLEEGAAWANEVEVDGGCLEHARAFVHRAAKARREAFIVHGLVADASGTRVSPHAWVRVGTAGGWLDVDPTLKTAVTPSTHLELAVDRGLGDAGRQWLRLFSGELRPTRR